MHTRETAEKLSVDLRDYMRLGERGRTDDREIGRGLDSSWE